MPIPTKTATVMALSLWLLFGAWWSHGLEIEGFEPDRTTVYKKIGDTQLKLHAFFPEGHQDRDTRPAIVFFFGGGWTGGSPSQFFPHCDYLSSRGMVAFSAEYRVASRHKTSPAECVKDAKSAMRWIRQHAGELGIDPEKILAGGGSAGGHLATATATLDGFNEEEDDTSIPCRPQALVLFNPVYDNGPGGYGHDRVKDYWESFSPLHNLTPTTPPTVVFFGTRDKHVPVETARKFQELMKEAGVRSELFLYEGEKHGFFNYGRGPAYQDTIAKMDAFLVSLGFLE